VFAVAIRPRTRQVSCSAGSRRGSRLSALAACNSRTRSKRCRLLRLNGAFGTAPKVTHVGKRVKITLELSFGNDELPNRRNDLPDRNRHIMCQTLAETPTASLLIQLHGTQHVCAQLKGALLRLGAVSARGAALPNLICIGGTTSTDLPPLRSASGKLYCFSNVKAQ
jgi:hypothetical protein